MTQNILRSRSASGYELLNDQPFPAFPFCDPSWIGFAFNRDLYGEAGVPKEVFESVLAETKTSGITRLTFEPGVTPLDESPPFPRRELSGWDEYMAFVKAIDFCPEYFLVATNRSLLFWFDPETVVVGGAHGVMAKAADHLGGMNKIMSRSANEFGVAVNDPKSDMATFIRNLGGGIS